MDARVMIVVACKELGGYWNRDKDQTLVMPLIVQYISGAEPVLSLVKIMACSPALDMLLSTELQRPRGSSSPPILSICLHKHPMG